MAKKRIRPPQRCFRASEEEWKMIDEKVKNSGLGSFSSYARKALIERNITVISRFEVQAIKELSLELSRIGNNINQIAKVANSSSKVFKAEVHELLENQKEVASLLHQILNEHRKAE